MKDGQGYEKPLPHPTSLSKPFWDALRQHKVLMQYCPQCLKFIFYPRRFCPGCLKEDLDWRQLSGKGCVYSYTIIRRPSVRGFESEAPYIFAVAELDEGPRVITNVIECLPQNIRVGQLVEAVFEDVTPDTTLLKFRPVGS